MQDLVIDSPVRGDPVVFPRGHALIVTEVDDEGVTGEWEGNLGRHYMHYEFLAKYFHTGQAYVAPPPVPLKPEEELDDLII